MGQVQHCGSDIGPFIGQVPATCVPVDGCEASLSVTHLENKADTVVVPSKCKSCSTTIATSCTGDFVQRLQRHDRIDASKPLSKAKSAKIAGVFNPPLPSVTQSYELHQRKNLGMLQLASHIGSKQKRGVLSIPKRSIPADFREVRARLETLLMVDHPNVLTLYEACEDEEFLCLIYEWPEGGLLVDHLIANSEAITVGHISGVTREILCATVAVDRFGIHHLDWDPSHLVLGFKNHLSPLKVLGFGLAGCMVPLVTTQNVSDSRKHFFVSPEMISDTFASMPHSKLHASDVWSIGTLVYMLFSGRPPFFGNLDAVYQLITKGNFSFGVEFSAVGRVATDCIEKMLTKRWQLRPTAADCLNHSFAQMQLSTPQAERSICQDALFKLDQFAKKSTCKQTLARLLIDLGFQSFQYSELEQSFRQLDLDGNGMIEVEELWEIAVNQCGIDRETASRTIADILRHCDGNANASVDISELLTALVLDFEGKDEHLLAKAFDKIDLDGDARITKTELFEVLRGYSDSLQLKDIKSFVEELDKDHDQKIDYNEFRNFFSPCAEWDSQVKNTLQQMVVRSERERLEFDSRLESVEQFFDHLRSAVCKMVCHYTRAEAPTTSEGGIYQDRQFLDIFRDVIDVIRNFAGRSSAMSDNSEEAVRIAHRIAGPQVWKTRRLSAHSSDETRSPREFDYEDFAQNSPQRVVTDQKQSEKFSDNGYHDNDMIFPDERSIAVDFMQKLGIAAGMHKNKLIVEAERSRQSLWLGVTRNMKEYLYPDILDSWDSSDNFRKNKANDKAHDSDDDEMHERDKAKRASYSRVMEAIIPWAHDPKKMERTVLAMKLAAGPPIMTLGRYDESEGPIREIRELGVELLKDHGLAVEGDEATRQLRNINLLLRYKCVKSFLPRLMLWEGQLQRCLDSRVLEKYRKQLFFSCIPYVCQMVERILFSLAGFLCLQEQAFRAAWNLERTCCPPPTASRFLPFRGEIEDSSRTPPLEGTAKVGKIRNETDHLQKGLQNLQRLDRIFVRAKGQDKSRLEAKLAELARRVALERRPVPH